MYPKFAHKSIFIELLNRGKQGQRGKRGHGQDGQGVRGGQGGEERDEGRVCEERIWVLQSIAHQRRIHHKRHPHGKSQFGYDHRAKQRGIHRK